SHRAFTPLNSAAGTVHVFYWVTVRVNRQIPQLFSAVLNNTTALVSARATGALTDTVVQGSLILLDRENDSTPFMAGTHGVDLVVAGNAPVQAPAGMLIASTNCGQHVSTNCADTTNAAAQLQGTQSSVTNTSYTYFRGNGGWDNTGNPTWTNAPVGGKPDGPSFYDPFSGRGQPPLQTNITTPAIPVIGGTLPAGTYGSGAYFAATGAGCSRTNLSQCTATGAPITITGDVTFSGGNFGQFIFYGGLYDQRKNVTLGPGMYVLAGTTSASTPVLNLDNNSNVTDGGPVEAEGSTAGEMLVFTDLNYPGLSNYTPQAITDYNTANPGAFQFGSVGFKAGNNTTINIHGLDQSNSNLPSNLDTFAPVVFWQDQANSSVAYDSQGNVLFNPNGIVQGCPTTDSTLDSPCPGGVGTSSTSPGMTLDAHANIDLYGAIYQPRGGWITMQGNGGITGPIQLITGAINDQGGTALTLTGLSNPVTTVSAALIE
ncbi:MAG TPA: hypothetical protein VKV15_27650, partial [Bryobacteraceae bacterium]|nr:hypothetical protein [Bryobacteraceae bacterium]